MTTFTVHAPDGDAVAAARADRLTYLPEKMSWGALLLPMVWAPWRRLWWAFAAWIVATVAIDLFAARVDAGLAAVVSIGFALWFALAGNDLRRWAAERRGDRLVGVVEARDEAEAEARFLAHLADPSRPRFGRVEAAPSPAADRPAPSLARPASASPAQAPVVGWAVPGDRP
ncbi:MAG: DUF2628 domain-containing protein [Hyphomicrobiales bacterium]|nr:DUF2628 domain-containing protein [Hyphomicrobiales bacterium]